MLWKKGFPFFVLFMVLEAQGGFLSQTWRNEKRSEKKGGEFYLVL